MSAPDPLITRLESLGPDEWRPEPPPELVMPRAAEPAPRRRRTLTLRPLPAFAVALLLLAVGAGGALIAGSRDSEPGRTLTLAPLGQGAGEGKVRLARAGGRATLVVSGLGRSRPGEFYELWLLSPPGDLVSLGSFRVGAGGRATLEVPLPVDPSRYRFLDVSVEPDDGDPSHSARSVLRGRT
jgi:anti-sigma-K factor RskA